MTLSAADLKQMIDEIDGDPNLTVHSVENLQAALKSYIEGKQALNMNLAFQNDRKYLDALNKRRGAR